jgi:beta-phosphoglucomutase-like phosphatase (HAD superfamily)
MKRATDAATSAMPATTLAANTRCLDFEAAAAGIHAARAGSADPFLLIAKAR